MTKRIDKILKLYDEVVLAEGKYRSKKNEFEHEMDLFSNKELQQLIVYMGKDEKYN